MNHSCGIGEQNGSAADSMKFARSFWCISCLTCIVFLVAALQYLSLAQAFSALLYLASFFWIVYCSVLYYSSQGLFGCFRAKPLVARMASLCFASILLSIALEALTVVGTPGSNLFEADDWSFKRNVMFIPLSYVILFAVDYLSMGIRARRASVIQYGESDRYEFRIERLFGAVALTIGMMGCIFLPITTGISWDDHIHFKNALDLSYLVNPHYTAADEFLSEVAVLRSYGDDVLSISGIDFRDAVNEAQRLNEMYDNALSAGSTTENPGVISFLSSASLGYVPSAIGLWAGRALHVPFSVQVIFGRMGNCIAYVGLFYLAIKTAPVKKTLFFAVGLIPVNLFLACNYSYDVWLTSLSALGFASFLRVLWGESAPISLRRMTSIIAILTCAVIVKAVYFPLLGILFLVPKKRFISKSQRNIYYALIIVAALFILLSFVLPFLSTVEVSVGDVRGGEGVSQIEQVQGILGNPFGFIKMLSLFLITDYLSPISISKVFTFIEYARGIFAIIPWAGILLVLAVGICAVCETNRESCQLASLGGSMWVVVCCLSTIVLVSTSLYISFTPAGLDTVNGCQPRYLIPLLIPFIGIGMNLRLAVPLGLRRVSSLVCILLFVLVSALQWILIFAGIYL